MPQTAVVIKPPFSSLCTLDCLLMYSLCMFVLPEHNVTAQMGFSPFFSLFFVRSVAHTANVENDNSSPQYLYRALRWTSVFLQRRPHCTERMCRCLLHCRESALKGNGNLPATWAGFFFFYSKAVFEICAFYRRKNYILHNTHTHTALCLPTLSPFFRMNVLWTSVLASLDY